MVTTDLEDGRGLRTVSRFAFWPHNGAQFRWQDYGATGDDGASASGGAGIGHEGQPDVVEHGTRTLAALERLADAAKEIASLGALLSRFVTADRSAEVDRRQVGQLLHLKEAAEYVGMTASGLRKLVDKRAIRFCQRKAHSPLLFRLEWLDEFIAKHTLTPKNELPPAAPFTRRRRRPPRPSDQHDDRHGFG